MLHNTSSCTDTNSGVQNSTITMDNYERLAPWCLMPRNPICKIRAWYYGGSTVSRTQPRHLVELWCLSSRAQAQNLHRIPGLWNYNKFVIIGISGSWLAIRCHMQDLCSIWCRLDMTKPPNHQRLEGLVKTGFGPRSQRAVYQAIPVLPADLY